MVKRSSDASAAASLDAAFTALADPTRRAIVERLLREGERSAGEIAAPFAISKPAISKQVQTIGPVCVLPPDLDPAVPVQPVDPALAEVREVEPAVRCRDRAFETVKSILD